MLLNASSSDEIASSLNVSRKTVANYHYAIKSKLGVASDIELIHYGLRHGLIAPVTPPRPT
jgi:DNA-binding NarL/FixJ family response regulator